MQRLKVMAGWPSIAVCIFRRGNTLNMGVMLMNITTIYLTRRDTSGLHCAAAPCFFRFSDCHRDSECRQGNDYPQ